MAATTEVVIRLDDVRNLSDRLESVWSVLENHGVPVHLEVIPIDLDPEQAESLCQRAQRSAAPVSAHQHGYRHVNHSPGKRRYEFGEARSANQQREDIRAGRKILEQRLGNLFEPIFTPPWDRVDATTLDILAEETYLGVSVIDSSSSPEHPVVPRVSMTTDPVDWRPTPVHRPWQDIHREVRKHLAERGYAGIELHHEIMDDEAIAGLDTLLGWLEEADWPTMRRIAERLAAPARPAV